MKKRNLTIVAICLSQIVFSASNSTLPNSMKIEHFSLQNIEIRTGIIIGSLDISSSGSQGALYLVQDTNSGEQYYALSSVQNYGIGDLVSFNLAGNAQKIFSANAKVIAISNSTNFEFIAQIIE